MSASQPASQPRPPAPPPPHLLLPCPQLLDKKLLAAEYGGSQAMAALDSQLAEAEDIISYFSDVLSIGEQDAMCLQPSRAPAMLPPAAGLNVDLPLAGSR